MRVVCSASLDVCKYKGIGLCVGSREKMRLKVSEHVSVVALLRPYAIFK